MSIAAFVFVGQSLKPQALGGVVAVVNGREVTRQDLQAEAAARGVAYDGTTSASLLKAVVERKLLAQAAQREKLDELPDFPANRARAVELALARQKVTALDEGEITAADISQWKRENPRAAACESPLELHQVTFASLDEGRMSELSTIRTLVDLKAALTTRRLAWREADVTVDPAELPQAYAKALCGLEPGAMLLSLQSGRSVAVAVIGPRQPPLSPSDDVARTKLREQRRAQALQRALAVLYRNAQVVYQPGYAPP